MDWQLNGRLETNSPNDGELNGQHENNSSKGWMAQKYISQGIDGWRV